MCLEVTRVKEFKVKEKKRPEGAKKPEEEATASLCVLPADRERRASFLSSTPKKKRKGSVTWGRFECVRGTSVEMTTVT